MEFIYQGFTQGFSLGYHGPPRDFLSPNLKMALDHPQVFQAKVDKELKLGRFLGPFDKPSFQNYQSIPLSLVDKCGADPKLHPEDPKCFRLISHLSFPNGNSINSFIPERYSKVNYKSFNSALMLVSKAGKNCWLAKSDLDSAFHNVPMDLQSLHCLGFTMNGQYYLDTCLPFGSSSSCFIFEIISSAIDWIVTNNTGLEISHYLDDFLFARKTYDQCLLLLDEFKAVCAHINFLVSQDKTFLPSQQLDYLGIGINTINMRLTVTKDKVIDAMARINSLLYKRRCKVRELQSICGVLNFLHKIIRPGKAFLKRIYETFRGKPNHHHVNVNSEMKKDLRMWIWFLQNFQCNRPIPTYQ